MSEEVMYPRECVEKAWLNGVKAGLRAAATEIMNKPVYTQIDEENANRVRAIDPKTVKEEA